MDILKKNLVSIIFGGVALLAFGAVFWPISGMFEDLQKRADKSKSTYSALDGLLKKQRQLPLLDPNSTEQKSLEQFPTESVIARGQAVTGEIKKESDAMVAAALAMNQAKHEFLVPKALPGVGAESIVPARNFRTRYQEHLDVNNPDETRRAQAMPMKLMQAGMKPSDADIAVEKKNATDYILTNDLFKDDKGREMNRPQVDQKIALVVGQVADRLRSERASNIKVYIDPLTMDIQPQIALNPGLPPSPAAVFWAQIGTWIQEDICNSIAEANNGASNVMESVVKRVEKIDIPDEFARTSASVQSNPEGGAPVTPVSSDPAMPIPPNFSVSPTGRMSNGLYDVVHFKLKLICDAEQIPTMLQALSKNKFITIYETDIRTVDSGAEQGNGYYYGTKPVVQLDMQGEALFLRQWTMPIMPTRVKNEYGIAAVPAPQ